MANASVKIPVGTVYLQFPVKGSIYRLDPAQCGSGIVVSDDRISASTTISDWRTVRYEHAIPSRGKVIL